MSVRVRGRGHDRAVANHEARVPPSVRWWWRIRANTLKTSVSSPGPPTWGTMGRRGAVAVRRLIIPNTAFHPAPAGANVGRRG